jgi:DNA-binding NarL/FixJ family response regulator
MRRLKLLIADDHRLMLAAIRCALQQAEDIEIVGEAQAGSQVLPLVGQTHPDLVLLDIRMPGMDGLKCLQLLRERYPKVKTVVLSGIDDPQIIQSVLEAGANAYILKTVDPQDLASAVRQAANGTVFHTLGMPAGASGEDPAKEVGLSDREVTILKELASGRSNKQIAKELWLAEQTIKFHLTNIYRKLGVSSRTEAVRSAYERGIVSNPMLSRTAAA